jgi:glutamate-ammonia-ligase adenylyltransferase
MISPSTDIEHRAETDKEAQLRTLEKEVVSAGIALSTFLPVFQKNLRATPDPDRALNNFLRFIASGFSSSLLRNFEDKPVLLSIALTLFSHSQYLADILVRSPELFHWLTATNALTEARSREDYRREVLSVMAPFDRIDKKFDALKRFQRREILKISTRDILKEADLPTITSELSWLADSLIDAAVNLACEELRRRVGTEIASTFCVVGLGKLGGAELNFSSDIDLMFVYDAEGDLDFDAERIHSYHEYYCRLAEFVVRRLSEHTDEGHLYRIDMRLRPDGAVGPLAMSREGFLRYYESRGELWERQMLLKARIVAGNKEVGEKFLDDLRPFIYPSTVLLDPREEIVSIKKRIEANLSDEEANTLNAIEKLEQASRLTRKEAEQLREGYMFLRQIEHRLQLLYGAQTHELPDKKEEILLLGRRLGFGSPGLFEKALLRTQAQIRKIYDSVFLQSQVGKGSQPAQKRLSITEIGRLVAQGGFLDRSQAVGAIERLQKEVAQFGNRDVMKRLLEHLRMIGAPDYGLKNFRILSSSQPLQRTMDQVLSNDRLFNLLLTLCSRSNRLTVQLVHEPLLFESLMGRTEDFFKPGLEWQFLLKNDPVRFRAFNEFKVVVSYLSGLLSIEQSGREFSSIADCVVHSVTEDLLARFPESRNRLCILALGKYGGEELLIGSDLDLIILFSNSGKTDSGDDTEKIVVDFLRSFSTDSGQVYNIDLRLRPEGKNAPLAIDFSYYEKYLDDRAEPWEKQALVKARMLSRACDHRVDFEMMRNLVLTHIVNMKDWPNKIRLMKKKMEDERTDEKSKTKDLKVGKGGLIDLEFLIQASQLKFHSEFDDAVIANSFDAIGQITRLNVLRKREITMLKRNYVFLRTLELSIRLNSESTKFVLPEDKILLQTIAAGVGERSAKKLNDRIKKVRKENRSLMNNVFVAIK